MKGRRAASSRSNSSTFQSSAGMKRLILLCLTAPWDGLGARSINPNSIHSQFHFICSHFIQTNSISLFIHCWVWLISLILFVFCFIHLFHSSISLSRRSLSLAEPLAGQPAHNPPKERARRDWFIHKLNCAAGGVSLIDGIGLFSFHWLVSWICEWNQWMKRYYNSS